MSLEENAALTDADLLVTIAEESAEFCRWQGRAYVTVLTGKGLRTLQLRGPAFATWLRLRFRELQGRITPAAAVKAAVTALEDSTSLTPERPVFLRSAHLGRNVYIDLADESGAAVEITPGGWRIVQAPPVRFVRGSLAQVLPMPVPGGSLDLLRQLLNLREDGSFQLLITWCVAALMPRGPYPLLAVAGEQGSAKTTTATIVHDLVDPSLLPLRALPRSERDLYISTAQTHVLSYDNASVLAEWQSDAFCKISTGGGMATRQLFTDAAEVYFQAIKPVILNGIEDVVTRPDLADRAIILNLPAIPEDRRLDPAEFEVRFQEWRPRIFGALLDLMVLALARLPALRTERLPRMAGFARLGIVIEDAFGPPGCFMQAYDANRSMSSAVLAESDPVVAAIVKLMVGNAQWTGTATDLARALEPRMVPPKRLEPAALAGRLRRLAPVLRANALDIEFDREGKDRTRTIVMTRRA